MQRFSHGGNIYEGGGNWLDFSANINPLGLTDNIRRAVGENIENIVNYPDPKNRELMSAISSVYDIPAESIILGNGASELIYLFFSTMRFKKVLMLAPSYGDYERSALASGSEVEFMYLKSAENFSINWDKLKCISKNYDCLVLASPNNPTGGLIEACKIEKFMEETLGGPFIFIDESFMDFIEDKQSYETLKIAADCPRLFTLRSLTKFYALPGLRIGFGAAHKNLILKMSAAKDVWNVNILAAKAAVAALSDENYKKNTLLWLKAEQEFMTARLKELNIKFFEPTVNFILLEFENEDISAKIREGLKARGILVRNCENFIALDSRFIRIAIKRREDNERLLNDLREILNNV